MGAKGRTKRPSVNNGCSVFWKIARSLQFGPLWSFFFFITGPPFPSPTVQFSQRLIALHFRYKFNLATDQKSIFWTTTIEVGDQKLNNQIKRKQINTQFVHFCCYLLFMKVIEEASRVKLQHQHNGFIISDIHKLENIILKCLPYFSSSSGFLGDKVFAVLELIKQIRTTAENWM